MFLLWALPCVHTLMEGDTPSLRPFLEAVFRKVKEETKAPAKDEAHTIACKSAAPGGVLGGLFLINLQQAQPHVPNNTTHSAPKHSGLYDNSYHYLPCIDVETDLSGHFITSVSA